MISENLTSFSFNILEDFQNIWHFEFMRNAFIAGTIVSIVAGVIGYFVVLRKSSFAAHALSHIGFAGAAGAVLIGINPLLGLIGFTTTGGVVMALLGKKIASRDVQIGTVLAFMLGLGVLFISLYKGYSTETYSLLFGQILGISSSDVLNTLIVSIFTIGVVIFIYKKLLFTSLDEDVAEAKGVSVTFINGIFMVLIAVATSIAVQVVGVLLIFALMVTPAAIAERLAKRPIDGIMISISVALFTTWVGLFISYYLPYPVSFFITSIVFVIYILVKFLPSLFSR